MKSPSYLCYLWLFLTLSACNQTTYTGILQQKPWSKSTQSYCAQGSAYYILEVGEKEYVVKHKNEDKLKGFDQQKVVVKGMLEAVKIEPPNTELPSQVPDMGPIGEAFTCTVLNIKRIKRVKN